MTEINLLKVPGTIVVPVLGQTVEERDKRLIKARGVSFWMEQVWGLTGAEAESAWWGVLSAENPLSR